MHLSVENFQGAAKVEITAQPGALLAGTNHQGKSSTIRAAMALLTAKPLFPGMKTADGGLLVRLGTAKATATLTGPDGVVTGTWPKAEITTTGDNPPRSSVYAVGLQHWVDLDEAKRIELLRSLLNAEPTMEDLEADLLERFIPGYDTKAQPDERTAKQIEWVKTKAAEIWKEITRDGWEATHTRHGNRMREAKGQWAYVTGEDWGSKKSEVWMPAGWDETLPAASQDSLTAEITAAKALLEDMNRREAVDTHKLAEMQQQAAQVSDLEAKLTVAITTREAKKSAADAAQQVVNALPPPKGQDSTECPACKTRLAVRTIGAGKYTLDIVPEVDQAEAERLAKQYNDAQTALANALSEANRAEAEVRTLEARLKVAREAVAKHAEARQQGAGSEPVSADDVNRAREAVRIAEQRLEAWTKWTEATRLNKVVNVTAHIVRALDAKQGVRRKVMERELARFNKLMADYCAVAGWGTVTITPEMTAEYDGRVYGRHLLADSEQFMVRTIIQLAIAELDKSDMVVVDALEVLENRKAAGLLKLLRQRGQPFIVGIKAEGPDKVPDLSRAKAGATFWFENGTCAAIGQ